MVVSYGQKGQLINADVNGSYNILRKAIPNAFSDGIGRGCSSAEAGQSARSKSEGGGTQRLPWHCHKCLYFYQLY